MHVSRGCIGCAIALSMIFLAPAETLAAGLKKVVAVSNFENKTSQPGQHALDKGMADQLADALIQSGQFTVVERQTLGDVDAEQRLAASGRTRASQSAQSGKLVSSQILIKGTITEFESQSSGSDSAVSFGGLSIGGKGEQAHVGLIIRLIDTTSGEVLDSQRVEGKAKSGGLSLGGNIAGVDFGTDGFAKTPLGKATQVAIDNAVEIIADGLRNVPFEARVIKATGRQILINAGASTGAQAGDEFVVWGLGEEIVDPVTGENLGTDEEEKGRIRITQVKEKYSKAEPVDSVGALAPGDIVRAR